MPLARVDKEAVNQSTWEPRSPNDICFGCDTKDVVFVADDLASWLIGLIADAGRKRLTTALFGADQERALRSAATAAVRLTASELRPDEDEQAERVALVISQVFSKPVPDAPLAGHKTVTEALRRGIAEQLAVLDDASLTGTVMTQCGLVDRGAQGGNPSRTAAELRLDELGTAHIGPPPADGWARSGWRRYRQGLVEGQAA